MVKHPNTYSYVKRPPLLVGTNVHLSSPFCADKSIEDIRILSAYDLDSFITYNLNSTSDLVAVLFSSFQHDNHDVFVKSLIAASLSLEISVGALDTDWNEIPAIGKNPKSTIPIPGKSKTLYMCYIDK